MIYLLSALKPYVQCLAVGKQILTGTLFSDDNLFGQGVAAYTGAEIERKFRGRRHNLVATLCRLPLKKFHSFVPLLVHFDE